MELTKKKREEVEALIYQVFDAIDPSKTNSEHYKKLFSKMSNEQFLKFVSLRFPYRYHEKPFVTEPDMSDIEKACKILGIPLMEKLNLPYLYTNKDGIPAQSKECLVMYIPLKKVKQFITKKNAMSVNTSSRDMNTGLLLGVDKNGKESDREFEALSVMGLEKTMEEFARPRADAMKAKNQMYNTINTTGMVTLDELPKDEDDSLSKNLLNTYLIGSLINSNLINQEYYLPITLKNKQRQVERK